MVRHESAKSSSHNAKHHKSSGGANKAAINKRTPNTVSYHLVPTKDSKHISMQVSGRNKSHTEKKASSPEVESPPWGTLLKEFTQETTLHGIRYATAHTRFILRRYAFYSLSFYPATMVGLKD